MIIGDLHLQGFRVHNMEEDSTVPLVESCTRRQKSYLVQPLEALLTCAREAVSDSMLCAE